MNRVLPQQAGCSLTQVCSQRLNWGNFAVPKASMMPLEDRRRRGYLGQIAT
jgi:hypothetical protein